MPSREEIDLVLREACIKLGFCLKPADQDRISGLGNVTAWELAVEIVKAEGMNPEYEVDWVGQLKLLIENQLPSRD